MTVAVAVLLLRHPQQADAVFLHCQIIADGANDARKTDRFERTHAIATSSGAGCLINATTY